MPRLLQIEEYTLKEIDKVKKYAVEHPYDETYRAAFLAGKALPVGDNPEHVLHIHDGYRVVYSISVLDSKKYHHLSISYGDQVELPGVPEAEVIMDLFGMGKDIYDLENVWIEESVRAVNLLKELV